MTPSPRRTLGASGLTVAPVAFGAMTLARDPELEGDVSPALLHALERGIDLIDTARVYPRSEAIIGATLKAWREPRPLISTKLAPLAAETFRRRAPLAEAYTPDSIRASVEASLAALGVETLDVVHLHQWFHAWTYEPAWVETLRGLREEGKLRLIAVSAQDHEHDALLSAVEGGLVDVVQVIFNLFESRPAVSLLPLAAAKGVGVIARCVLDSGGLTGTLSREAFAAHPFLKHAPFDLYAARLDALRADYVGAAVESLDELAVRFALSDPAVSALTLGCHTREFVDRNLELAARGPLPPVVADDIARRHVWTKNFYEALV